VLVDQLRKGGRAALLVLAAVLPFELAVPITRLGPLQLSSVELFLYVTLALWGASLVAAVGAGDLRIERAVRTFSASQRAVAGFALALFLSAALADAPRGPAFKFALRSAGGMLLFAAAADLLRARGAAARTAVALVAGALAAALLAIAEVLLASAATLLHPFHAQTFEALGSPRASGPFQYPNIAAMYLEAAAPLAVALGMGGLGEGDSRGAPRAGRVAGTALVTFVLLDGVLATASRGGLLGALIAVLAVSAVGMRIPGRRPAAWAAVGAALIVAVASGSSLARFRFWNDGEWYRAVIARADAQRGGLPPVLATSTETTESLEIQNQGQLPWLHATPTPVTLSYHWLDDKGTMVTADGIRTFLPVDVAPGGRARVDGVVRTPSRPGRYVLWWDLVHEHTTWFSERGNPGLREVLEVRGDVPSAVLRAAAPPPPIAPPLGERKPVPRGILWWAALKLFVAHPFTGIGPDNFRHRYHAVLGLSAGDADERLHANSLYFETLADLGVVGALAFTLVLAALLAAARRGLATLATRLLALGVAAALGTYLLHGVLDYFLEFTPTYAQFWLLAGMMAAIGTRPAATA
jgi:O-Antigen ligase